VCAAELWRRGPAGGARRVPHPPVPNPRFPIAQFPNPPLLAALAGWGLAAVTSGRPHDVGRAVFTLGLAIWAWEELVGGVNWFRRILGMGALVLIVAALASEL
jgi:hypothetical protein